MAWANIGAYTAADLTKGKAEIDEVIAQIAVKIIANKHRNGIFTDEEMYAMQFVNHVLVPRADEFSLAIAIESSLTTVKGLIEGAAYTMTQAEATTEAAVKTEIEEVIVALELDGVTPEVTKVSYTAATAGDAGDPDGTNGTYKFKVNLTKGTRTTVTAELTMTITATPHA